MSYKKNADGDEYYEKDANNDEVVKDRRYAKDRNEQPFYPRDRHGNEFASDAVTPKYISRSGRLVLPFKVNGDPNYEADATTNAEKYPVVDGKAFFGVNMAGHEVYAKTATLDEFYPSDQTPAKRSDGTKYYARTTGTVTVFPKEGTKEVYIDYIDPNNVYTIPTRYAKDANNHEYYPETITNEGYVSDYVVGEKYAEMHGTNQKVYPRDAHNNEFYLPDKTKAGASRQIGDLIVGPTKRYAATNDKKVILPSVSGNPALDPGIADPVVDLATNVKGLLIRDKSSYSGFLTDVNNPSAPAVTLMQYSYMKDKRILENVSPAGAEPGRKPRSAPAVAPAAPAKPSAASQPARSYGTWFELVLIAFFLILEGFVLWWFFLRDRTSHAVR